MKYWILILALPLLSASECGKKKEKLEEDKTVVTDTMLPCIQKIIDDASKETPPNIPVQVDEYLYNGKKAFLVTAHCCDQYNVLYDENCKMICAPTGGFSGKGDSKCPEFAANAKHVRLIWKNEKK